MEDIVSTTRPNEKTSLNWDCRQINRWALTLHALENLARLKILGNTMEGLVGQAPKISHMTGCLKMNSGLRIHFSGALDKSINAVTEQNLQIFEFRSESNSQSVYFRAGVCKKEEKGYCQLPIAS